MVSNIGTVPRALLSQESQEVLWVTELTTVPKVIRYLYSFYSNALPGIRNCTFINYPKISGDSKIHHAIGVRNPNNNQVSTRNFVESSKFVNVSTKFYIADSSNDGGKTTNLRDVDGSVSPSPLHTETKLTFSPLDKRTPWCRSLTEHSLLLRPELRH